MRNCQFWTCLATCVPNLSTGKQCLHLCLEERRGQTRVRNRIGQSRPDSGLDLSHFQAKVFTTLYAVPSSRGRTSNRSVQFSIQAQLLHINVVHINVKRFRGGLVFKAHRLVYHSTLGLRVIKKKKTSSRGVVDAFGSALAAAPRRSRTFDHPLFSVTPPYIAHCMWACGAKSEWSLFFLSLSPLSLASLHRAPQST